jgi:hypothetical protein
VAVRRGGLPPADAVRGSNLRPLLPSFRVDPGRNIGYYLVQQAHVAAGYESMLRLLEGVQALTPPDQEWQYGPKRFPEKASLIVGHFLRQRHPGQDEVDRRVQGRVRRA